MKRIFAFALTLVVVLSSCGSRPQKLVILHVNDTHSHFEPLRIGDERGGQGGVIEQAAFIDSVRRADGEENVLLLHAGDFSQGSSYFPRLNGDLEINVLNAMKFDCVTIGNHEFDNGLEDLARRLGNLDCPVVCANYDFSPFEVGKIIKPYAVIERGGKRIGIIGMLTDISRVVDRSVADRIPKLDDYEVVNRWAEYLKGEEKCDLVIMLSHLGFGRGPHSDGGVVKATRGVDLVIGGHSHSVLDGVQYEENLDGEKVPIVQDGSWGLAVGKIEME